MIRPTLTDFAGLKASGTPPFAAAPVREKPDGFRLARYAAPPRRPPFTPLPA